MNEKIKQLAEQAGYSKDFLAIGLPNNMEKFAELIVRECCVALHPMLRDQISRGQGVDLIKKHFGAEE